MSTGITHGWTSAATPDGSDVTPTNFNNHSGGLLATDGGQDTIKAHGSLGATATFDPADGNVHTGTLDADCTFTLAAPTGSGACTLELRLTQDATGGRTITWPGSVTVVGTLDTTASTTSAVVLETLDGGTSWTAWVVGSGSATPSGSAGGDLGGTYPSPTVTGLSHATAGGDLSGTMDAPAVARINGSPLGTTTGAASGQALAWNGSAWAPATVAAASLRPVMVADTDGTHWNVLVDGYGNAIMTS